jgi:hypothetical protein
MRWALLFLTTVLFVSNSNTLLAQDSSFSPNDVSNVIDSVATESPSIFDQQAIVPETSAINVESATETVTLPDVSTYTKQSFAGSSDVSFSQPTAQTTGNRG